MHLHKILGWSIVLLGVVLLVFGVTATGSVGEKVTEGITGRYSSGTMWYLIGGIALVLIGGALGLSRRGRK